MNETEVAIREDLSCVWRFVVPSNATRCADESEEIASRCTELFETFGDFVTPLEAELNVQWFREGAKVPTSESGGPDDRLDKQETAVSDPNRLEIESVLGAFEQRQSGDLFVPEVFVAKAKTRIRLESGDHHVDRSDYSVAVHANRRLDRQPNFDPLDFRISYSPNVDYGGIDAGHVFVLRVSSKTDIWFEDSTIGEENRDRLAMFLQRINSTLPVEKITRLSSYDSTEHMEKIF